MSNRRVYDLHIHQHRQITRRMPSAREIRASRHLSEEPAVRACYASPIDRPSRPTGLCQLLMPLVLFIQILLCILFGKYKGIRFSPSLTSLPA